MTITTRRQCLKTAAFDARVWAEQSASEAYSEARIDGEAPSGEALAAALRPYDSSMGSLSEAPSTSAGVPVRWAAIYDREVERCYRREIRRRIDEALASDDDEGWLPSDLCGCTRHYPGDEDVDGNCLGRHGTLSL